MKTKTKKVASVVSAVILFGLTLSSCENCSGKKEEDKNKHDTLDRNTSADPKETSTIDDLDKLIDNIRSDDANKTAAIKKIFATTSEALQNAANVINNPANAKMDDFNTAEKFAEDANKAVLDAYNAFGITNVKYVIDDIVNCNDAAFTASIAKNDAFRFTTVLATTAAYHVTCFAKHVVVEVVKSNGHTCKCSDNPADRDIDLAAKIAAKVAEAAAKAATANPAAAGYPAVVSKLVKKAKELKESFKKWEDQKKIKH